MFKDKSSEFCFFNDEIKLFSDIDSKIFEGSGELVYEVIKMIDGKPLFWEDHIDRIYLSFEKIGVNLAIDKEIFEKGATKIVEKDQMLNNNIKIVIGKFSDHINILIYNIKSKYPSDLLKKSGVKVKPFNYERLNPGAKLINLDYKREISNFISENDLFEAILVDHNGFVTEGSRSNIFFIKDNNIYTPRSSDVLLGITRMKLLELFRLLDLKVAEFDVELDSVGDYDGVFLSGTSINVLAVESIGEKAFSTPNNNIYKLIHDNFENMILEHTYW
ncbi:MAG: aminotransferase class IV [Acidaminobacteraceae bacterium]